MVAVFTAVTTYSAIIEYTFPDEGLPTMKDLVSIWDWWVWLVIGLGLLWVATFLFANQQRRELEHHQNWIIAHKARTGKFPAIPQSLVHLVDNYVEGKPISRNIRLKTNISHQQWHGLTEENRKRFLQIMDWQGLDRYDFLQHLKDTAPPGGPAITHLRRKR